MPVCRSDLLPNTYHQSPNMGDFVITCLLFSCFLVRAVSTSILQMARKSRLSKSCPSKSRPSNMGRKWTQDDVLAYNIKVVYQDLTTFFGVIDLPPPDVANDAITAPDYSTAKNDFWACAMLSQMENLLDPDSNHSREHQTIDFIIALFNVLGYLDVAKRRQTTLRPNLRYLASQGRPPVLDICLRDDLDSGAIILVVKVHKHTREFDPEPRLISDAIAAFHNDNIRRMKDLGTDPIASKVMPGIVMDGSMPTFYKIPVTPELVRAVESGKRPEQETVLYACRPEVPRPEQFMKPLDNRYIILSCYEAFKHFM